MLTFVLRVVPEALSTSRVVGRVEAVETGETALIRSAEELIGFLLRSRRDRGRLDLGGASGPGRLSGGHPGEGSGGVHRGEH